MTDSEILELALTAGFETDCKNFAAFDGMECTDELLAFARLVAEAERERLIAERCQQVLLDAVNQPNLLAERFGSIRSRTE